MEMRQVSQLSSPSCSSRCHAEQAGCPNFTRTSWRSARGKDSLTQKAALRRECPRFNILCQALPYRWSAQRQPFGVRNVNEYSIAENFPTHGRADEERRSVIAQFRAIPAAHAGSDQDAPHWLTQIRLVLQDLLERAKPPKYLWRTIAAVVLGGQVATRILKGKVHFRNTLEQLKLVGPRSMGVSLLTAGFVGMVFTIQFVREFAKLGLTRSVGGVLGLALSRELTPVVTSIILAGRVGSAFAAELGTMSVSEQTDSLRVLGSDPVDYLVIPRVLACAIAGPILNLMCFCMGIACSCLIAEVVYDVKWRIILDSCVRAVTAWDIITSMIKAWVFGIIIAVVSCSWGYTTGGGAKGVGDSTTSAVVISLVLIFIADFFLSFLFFQGQGDALKQLK